MEIYHDQIMTKSQAPSASTYVSNLINEILENKGWKGFHSQDVPGWYSNGTKFTFEKSWYKWKKNNKIVSYYCCNVWKINSQDDIIITDCKFDNSINIWPEFFGFFLCDFEYKINPPTKKINYLMNRVDNSRLKILYSLYDRGIIDQCNVSLIGTQRDNSIARLKDYHEDCPAQDFFKDKIPFRNWLGSLEQSVIDCEVSVVHESYFEEKMIVLTEKTFRALQLPRPFVIFGAPNVISWLKEIGFDVGEKHIDHSYDQIKDHNDRREAVLSSALKFNWQQNMIKDFEEMVSFNKKLLKKFKIEFTEQLKKKLENL